MKDLKLQRGQATDQDGPKRLWGKGKIQTFMGKMINSPKFSANFSLVKENHHSRWLCLFASKRVEMIPL